MANSNSNTATAANANSNSPPESPFYFYVPLEESLTEEAPGYGDAPVCWKCRNKNSRSDTKNKVCKVCHGRGRLAPRKVQQHRPGKITRGRKQKIDSVANTASSFAASLMPFPAGYQLPYYGPIVQNCTNRCEDHVVSSNTQQQKDPYPIWWPQKDEELCNLTGRGWRILQRPKSHRWTTDDLVTATVAVEQLRNYRMQTYLDLGCGNGSVLQMVLSAGFMTAVNGGRQQPVAVGLEARAEAVALARRSVAFNVGDGNPNSTNVSIVRGDLRDTDLVLPSTSFDLITGTPPYFAVGCGGVPHQGGMPSAVPSAPARCEFRGGWESYCAAAERWSHPQSHFVVCINYANQQRTTPALAEYGWCVQDIWFVRGKVTKKEPLFVVYHAVRAEAVGQNTAEEERNPRIRTLAVRDQEGDWTKEYKDQVLHPMGIFV